MERINAFLSLGLPEIAALFAPFETSLTVLGVTPLSESMGNSGYAVETDAGKFFLKIYSNATDGTEAASYAYWRDRLRVPQLFYHDGSKSAFPYAYTIAEWVPGVPLVRFVREQGEFPPELARQAGWMCGLLHTRQYPHDALLDERLNAAGDLPRWREKLTVLLNGRPGSRLKAKTVEALRAFVRDNPALLDRLEERSVFCHGDFSSANLMCADGELTLIDFEWAYAGSPYTDIGHFFRRRDDDAAALPDSGVYDAFADGYNAASDVPLPAGWLALARLCDVSALLCLLNYEHAPVAWVPDIERDILRTVCGFS